MKAEQNAGKQSSQCDKVHNFTMIYIMSLFLYALRINNSQ